MAHSHHHHHEVHHYNRSFSLGIALNILFVCIEVTYGFLSDSLALIADAGHNFSDVLTLLLAWGAYYLSQKHPTHTHTYGLRKVTIMASLISAILLFMTLGVILWEAIERLLSPTPADGMVIMIVAAIGVLINTATALLFAKGQSHDLNIKAAYLHMAADAAISFGVVIAGVIILFTGWLWVDPLLSILIVMVILVASWKLLKDSINLSIDAVPSDIDLHAVKNYLLTLTNVADLHDLHIWALSTTENALTVHLVTTDALIYNHMIKEIQEHLHHHFNISHSTIQIEKSEEDFTCHLRHH